MIEPIEDFCHESRRHAILDSYQLLNGVVAMELLPTTLGARQGDQAYNHKTDTHYVIKDKAYPPKKVSP